MFSNPHSTGKLTRFTPGYRGNARNMGRRQQRSPRILITLVFVIASCFVLGQDGLQVRGDTSVKFLWTSVFYCLFSNQIRIGFGILFNFILFCLQLYWCTWCSMSKSVAMVVVFTMLLLLLRAALTGHSGSCRCHTPIDRR